MSNAISGVQVLFSITAPPGCVTERFYADTGANRSLHPNGRSAVSYYRQKLDISTATTGKGMQSEGVGKMLLYAPNGSVFPGFDSVVFAKETSEKLASVGKLCDAGMVCVFDQFGLRTYRKEDCKVDGKVFTYDEREKKSKLFPLTLFRNTQEKLDTQSIIASLSLTSCANVERSFPVTIPPVINMPTFVSDGAELPAMLLAHT